MIVHSKLEREGSFLNLIRLKTRTNPTANILSEMVKTTQSLA